MAKHLDEVRVHDLLLRTIIGINEDERHNRQDVLINLTFYHDISAAETSDDITAVVDYRSVTKRVSAHVEQSSYGLVETLALTIARIVLTEFGVERVRVSVEKPGALRFTRSVGVTIERSREDL